MIGINVTSNIASVVQSVYGLERQIPYSLMLAVNRTATATKEAECAGMLQEFDRPGRYVLESLQVIPARDKRAGIIEAHVLPKEGADYWANPQVLGGQRRHKGSEKMLLHEWMIPADSILSRATGNILPGKMTQILSSVKFSGERGFRGVLNDKHANMDTSGPRNKKDRDFFLVRERRGGLVPGVWERVPKGGPSLGWGGKGRSLSRRQKGKSGWNVVARGVRPALIFIDQPRYAQQLNFYGIAHRTVGEKFTGLFMEALAQAIATAR